MSREDSSHQERQPLHKDGFDADVQLDVNGHHDQTEADPVSVSLIQHGKPPDRNGLSYTSEPMFQDVMESPYKDTTESDPNLRRVVSSDLLPRPWGNFQQVLVVSYVSCVFFIITGIFALKYTQRAMMHQSKGLLGMAQKDIKRAVHLIYISFVVGLLLLVLVPIIVVCSNGC
ncbi:uncharacterized protein LOC121372237 [Gigantopelta aegis]|uniref:uncharacterized protein LOC121372237 n=1 Tax=Gigantopelta aegis TaxID=1735272 RepID=UPI001B88E211|nr:uncharacterized protein LOC121372237 [Gigantopelta aegis]